MTARTEKRTVLGLVFLVACASATAPAAPENLVTNIGAPCPTLTSRWNMTPTDPRVSVTVYKNTVKTTFTVQPDGRVRTLNDLGCKEITCTTGNSAITAAQLEATCKASL